MKILARVATVLLLISVAAPAKLFACATCFGAAGSGQVEGMNGAIIGLLIVTVGMMAAFGSFFMYLKKRAGGTQTNPTANREETP